MSLVVSLNRNHRGVYAESAGEQLLPTRFAKKIGVESNYSLPINQLILTNRSTLDKSLAWIEFTAQHGDIYALNVLHPKGPKVRTKNSGRVNVCRLCTEAHKISTAVSSTSCQRSAVWPVKHTCLQIGTNTSNPSQVRPSTGEMKLWKKRNRQHLNYHSCGPQQRTCLCAIIITIREKK